MNGIERITTELQKELGHPERITKRRLIDALNYSNFQRQPIIVTLEHLETGDSLSVKALPEPCLSESMTCLWSDPPPEDVATAYRCRGFLMDRGDSLFVVEPPGGDMDERGASFTLPEHCRVVHPRQVRRYAPERIRAAIELDGAISHGVLEDFSSQSFRVRVAGSLSPAAKSLNPETRVGFILTEGEETIYLAECTIVRVADSDEESEFVLAPIQSERLLNEREPDTLGYVLTPKPEVSLEHPFTKRRVIFEVKEISHSWLSILEYYERSALCPGLVISKADLSIPSGFSIQCTARVRWGEVGEVNGRKVVEWRVAIAGAGDQDRAKLYELLKRVSDQKTYGGGKVDIEDLIGFFFDTGFVYPKKYQALQPYREQFLETYKRLYLESPTIARHFVQQDKGVILGHLSMIRFYRNTWMIQHHAGTGLRGAGLTVLDRARDYVNEFRHIRSSHMKYLICYFRPDNRFPNRMFGGFARALANPERCSIDRFAYLNWPLRSVDKHESDEGWTLTDARDEDLAELRDFYKGTSGGLMIRAFDMVTGRSDTGALSKEYEKLGFKRQKALYALKRGQSLGAVVMVLVSDIGLNMSNLTNCIHVFVVNSEKLPRGTLLHSLRKLAHYYDADEVPILVYPMAYAETQGIPFDKIYNLWAFDTAYTGRFYEFSDWILGRSNGSK